MESIKDIIDFYEPNSIKHNLFILKQGTTFAKIKDAIRNLKKYLYTPKHKFSFKIYKAFSKFEKDETKDSKLRNLISKTLDEISEFLVEHSGIMGG